MYLHLLVAAFAFAFQDALAADCAGDGGANPLISWAWDMRQAACGDGACQNGFSTDSPDSCNLTMPIGGGWAIDWVATDSTGGFANCWGASMDIINQCFVTGAYTQSSGSSAGKWADGSESYSLTLAFSSFIQTYNPNDYAPLDGETNSPPPYSNPAPPLPSPSATSVADTSSSSAATPGATLTCSNDCRGYVPNESWCLANCPCFTPNTVC